MSEKKAQNADLSALRIDRSQNADGNDNGNRMKIIVMTSVTAVVVLALFLVLSGSSETVAYKTTEVLTMYPSQSESILTASGYVVAQTRAAVASKATGRLESLSVEEGDAVKAGQTIARLEHRDVDAALEQARASLKMVKATLLQNRANFEEAELNFKRQKGLLDKGLISQAEFDISQARFKSSEAAVAAAQAQVALSEAQITSAEVDVENTIIRAPFDGTVLTKNADIGEMVAPFAASSNSRGAVVTIADMNSLEVEADVSESNIQKVTKGRACEIVLDAFPSIRYPAYVHKIVPTADRAKATVLTKIRFKELDNRVLPEMSAKVHFLSGESKDTDNEPITAVPESALLKRNGQEVLFVVEANQVTETPVTTGRSTSGRVEILRGVSAGQTVILNPTEKLKTGARISTK